MDSNRIKRLATGAREGLRREVSARLDAVLAAGSGERLADPAAVERLERRVRSEGRERVVDSAAYTWFNRLCALRYMDALEYTPVGAVTPQAGSTSPAVLADAQAGLFAPEYAFEADVRSRVTSLLAGGGAASNATEAAYAELLRAVCDHYAGPMPFLFGEDAASWLLMPRSLLAEGSMLRRVVDEMDGESCKSVEVLGWLYQHYIAERKDEVFAGFKKGRKAGPDEIGPATQLFTPAWIVKYLCENSLGRLWMLNRPASRLAEQMEYYIAPEGDEPHCDVASASDIRVLDPACGSGHILVYAFDLLFDMYEEEGWPPEDVPSMILQDNLRGLEVDRRAAEIAMFALAMKARGRDPRFLERGIVPDVRVLEPAALDGAERALLSDGFLERSALLDAMAHMTEAGSLFRPEGGDAAAIRSELARLAPQADSGDAFAASLREKLNTMLANVEALEGAYHCVVANPPYMGMATMNKEAGDLIKGAYPDEKGDLCTCFMARGSAFCGDGGYSAMVTMQSWMFLGSFERMRARIIEDATIVSMAHLGTRAFDSIAGEVVSATAAVIEKSRPDGRPGAYVRLVDVPGEREKAQAFRKAIADPGCGRFYRRPADSFKSIPGAPIAYWASDALIEAFRTGVSLSFIAKPRVGLQTSNNSKYLRFWHECTRSNISFDCRSKETSLQASEKWYPHNKGGSYRKWIGNSEYVVNYKHAGKDLAADPAAATISDDVLFASGITYSRITSGVISFRLQPPGFIFDSAAVDMFPEDDLASYLLGLLNSSAVASMMSFLVPTLNAQPGDISKIPVILTSENDIISASIDQCCSTSKSDWDSFETSWDFKRHPLV